MKPQTSNPMLSELVNFLNNTSPGLIHACPYHVILIFLKYMLVENSASRRSTSITWVLQWILLTPFFLLAATSSCFKSMKMLNTLECSISPARLWMENELELKNKYFWACYSLIYRTQITKMWRSINLFISENSHDIAIPNLHTVWFSSDHNILWFIRSTLSLPSI